MLRSLKDLEGYSVHATDGEAGSVANVLFDDERWGVRYLVVETGRFLDERRVLISPVAFREVEWSSRRFHLALTVDKVRNSPSVDVDKPVSRQHERDYHQYYGYPPYWLYGGPLAMGIPGGFSPAAWTEPPDARADDDAGDVHLRSAKEVRGYRLRGSDGEIGHVDDFIVDDATWGVHYLVIDTSNWWFGKKVLVAPRWVDQVSWPEQQVHVAMSREAVKNSPDWNGTAAVDREYEARLYSHYGQPVYWGRQEHTPDCTSDETPRAERARRNNSEDGGDGI